MRKRNCNSFLGHLDHMRAVQKFPQFLCVITSALQYRLTYLYVSRMLLRAHPPKEDRRAPFLYPRIDTGKDTAVDSRRPVGVAAVFRVIRPQKQSKLKGINKENLHKKLVIWEKRGAVNRNIGSLYSILVVMTFPSILRAAAVKSPTKYSITINRSVYVCCGIVLSWSVY